MSLFSLLSHLEQSSHYRALTQAIEEGTKELSLSGLWGSSKAYLVASVQERFSFPSLIITPNVEVAEKLRQDLESFSQSEVYLFPAWEVLPGEDRAPHAEVMAERLRVLEELVQGHQPLIVAPIQALLNKIVPPWILSSSLMKLRQGQSVDMENLLKKLVDYGYQPEAMVEEKGDFSRRGAILDIYPLTYEHPLRIEFFADTIESMRFFSVTSQRSLNKVREVIILPYGLDTPSPSTLPHGERIYNGVILQDTVKHREAHSQRQCRRQPKHTAKGSAEGSRSTQPKAVPILRQYCPKRGCKARYLTTLLSYLPPHALVFLDEPAKLHEMVNQALSQYQGTSRLADYQTILKACRKKHLIYISLLPQTAPGMKPGLTEHIEVQSLESYQGQFDLLTEKIRAWKEDGYRIVLICNNEGEEKRLKELLKERVIETSPEIFTSIGRLQSGFLFPEIRLALITDRELFGRYRLRRPRRTFKGGVPVSSFLDLKEGDYLVHVQQGIGKYLGVERLRADGRKRDFLVLEYLNEDKLYVPVEQLHLVQKYVGVEGHSPHLSKLGSGGWARTKERIKRSIRDMASELLELHAARETREGFAFSRDTSWQHEFESAFIYEETPDQLRTIKEIKQDMESPRPMDRLICGDVGYGKTEVAVRAAFKAVMDSKQVAVLVPTTVLAQQHWTTFTDRMADYPIKVAMLSRFRTRLEQKETVEGLKAGTIDIVIGTHRLLQKDIAFKDLGLVIIDEEQRFGVAHKERLKKLRKLVDVLTLTATPIPRTLHMSLTGIRDMSTINTPPEDRLPIQTAVIEYDEGTVAEAIRREIGRSGQVFFVHNRVQGIDKVADRLRRLVPEARVAVAHGQMPESSLEKVMLDFLSRKIDVLVATTIIESGLDIPNVNTIIINRADTFGLADLYQLRGRVGRFKHLAFAYLLFPKYLTLAEEAEKRLKTIEEFSDLGSGFRIAMRDLEIRGAGNLLGPEQHGHIVELGFDLYCKLLRQTVRELKGEKVEEEIETTLDLGLEAYIPDNYIPDTRQRLAIYRKMAELVNSAGLKDLEEELKDRFGSVPPLVKRLLSLIDLKFQASRLGLNYLGLTRKSAASEGNQLIAKFGDNGTMALELRPEERENPIQTVRKFLQTLHHRKRIS